LEREASRLTQQLGTLSDDNTLDQRYLAELEEASTNETTPPPDDLDELYRQAGVVLPGTVKKRFDDVKAFHESVLRNRRSYLFAETQATKERISERNKEKDRIDLRRSEIMSILTSSGALEHFTALQGELSKTEAQLEVLRQKHETAEALESGGIRLKSERTRLVERLRQDYEEEEKVIEDAILTFNSISSALYDVEASGKLTLTPTENGPEIDPRIPGAKSKGVNNMQIYCFDMMLMVLSLKRGRSPGFLVHDSHLFDGVDERQVGKALALGRSLAEQHGFQYLVTMNTDDIPKEVPAGFSVRDYALPVTLTDATEDGGLFGLRFD
ncbi:MAG: ABC-three component system protein, partial [Myxococcales bacterium]